MSKAGGRPPARPLSRRLARWSSGCAMVALIPRRRDPGTAQHRGQGPARGQRRSADCQAQPHHQRLGCLLPDRGVQAGVPPAGPPRVEAHLQVGQVLPPEQVEALGGHPVFRPVRQVPAGQVGVRRPPQRPLPTKVRLDPHRPTPDGARAASPDDPALADFWATRHRRSKPLLDSVTLRLFRAQDGCCSLCGALLLHADRGPQTPDEWEQWFKVVRHATRKHAVEADPGTPDGRVAPRLVHTGCRRRRVRRAGGRPALLTAREPSGLA